MTTDDLTYEQKIALAKELLAEAFNAASSQYGLNRKDLSRLALQIALYSANSSKADPASLPQEAPEPWRQRDLTRRENAPTFIRRVYGQWLGAGLERRDLATLDPELYRALSVWLIRHPDDPIAAHLPPQHELTNELIAQLSAVYPTDLLRKLGRAIDTRERSKQSWRKIKMPR